MQNEGTGGAYQVAASLLPPLFCFFLLCLVFFFFTRYPRKPMVQGLRDIQMAEVGPEPRTKFRRPIYWVAGSSQHFSNISLSKLETTFGL